MLSWSGGRDVEAGRNAILIWWDGGFGSLGGKRSHVSISTHDAARELSMKHKKN